MKKQKNSVFETLIKTSWDTQEQLMRVKKKGNSFVIGLPREIAMQEHRITLTPDAVALLIGHGHEVWVEHHAGLGARFTDEQYSEAGAKIAYTAKEVYVADILLKIEPPTLEEITYMRSNQVIISALQPGNLEKTYICALLNKKVSALAYELIEDRAGEFPLVRALSEIAGNATVSIASEYLRKQGVMFGGITGVPPTKVVIIGAGTVAEYCARAALNMGVEIQVFDNHMYKLKRIKEILGRQFFTSTLNVLTLSESLKTADVVVGALRPENNKPRHVISEEMVKQMKDNALIIDLSIDQGGCVMTSDATTHHTPVFKKHGVIHYCVPNVPSRVARTSSMALSNIITPMLLQEGGYDNIEEMIFDHSGLIKGIYTYWGNLTNQTIAQKFSIPYKDMELLIATRL